MADNELPAIIAKVEKILANKKPVPKFELSDIHKELLHLNAMTTRETQAQLDLGDLKTKVSELETTITELETSISSRLDLLEAAAAPPVEPAPA